MTVKGWSVKQWTDEAIEAAVEDHEESEREAREERAMLLEVLSAQRAEEAIWAREVKQLHRASINIRAGRIGADSGTLHAVEQKLREAKAKRDAIALEIAETHSQLDAACGVELAPWWLDFYDIPDVLDDLD